MSEFIDAEFTIIELPIKLPKLDHILWQDAEGNRIPVTQLDDTHLRNIALVLMGMGYVTWNAPDDLKVRWLAVLKMEWHRRRYAGGLRIRRAPSSENVTLKKIKQLTNQPTKG